MSEQPLRTRRSRLGRATAGVTLALAVVTAGVVGFSANRADADPNGELKYPAGATATRFTGQAFDTCAAPSLSTMRAWLDSPYRAIGIYISGKLRACRQPNLTASWVREVSAMGWKLIPIDVGRQAPCTKFSLRISSNSSEARQQGIAAGRSAVSAARALGILPGSALYSDIENYDSRDKICSGDVHAYLNGWTRALHSAGYLSGVYGNLQPLVDDLVDAQRTANSGKGREGTIRPDMLWNAEWDRTPKLTGWSGVESHLWAAQQRIKQYRGDHRATYGGVSLTIDSNVVDAAVATVAYSVATPTGVDLVSKVAPSEAAAGRNPGARLDLVCVTHSAISSLGAWYQTADATWIPQAALAGNSTVARFADRIPTCATPYQVGPGLKPLRSAPTETADSPGTLAGGTVAWIVCEQPGTVGGAPGFWQRLETGQWVSGVDLLRSSDRADSPAIPACPFPAGLT